MWTSAFAAANALALASWMVLILLPRPPWLGLLIGRGVVGLMSLAYAALILVFFFRVEGGGFGSLEEVRRLFMSDPVLLAGWLHYLAFDLFVGLHIAREADAAGLSRVLQAPILAATFMFGPLGLVLFLGTTALYGSTRSFRGAA